MLISVACFRITYKSTSISPVLHQALVPFNLFEDIFFNLRAVINSSINTSHYNSKYSCNHIISFHLIYKINLNMINI